jgi:hypothetical protein
MGDVALLGKITLVGNERQGVRGGFGVAVLETVTLPTGSRNGLEGEGAVTASARVAGEWALGVGGVQGQIGFAARTAERSVQEPSGGVVRLGESIPWSFGLMMRPRALMSALDSSDIQSWELALHGSLPAGPVAPWGLGSPGASVLSPVLLAVDDRIALSSSRDIYVLGGLDIGLNHAIGVPEIEGILGCGWAPREHDSDHDGVPDNVDQCPDLPEDRDGIQDDDGCPEDDADEDGVPDTEDACPLIPGARSTDRKHNGCPTSAKD